MFKLFWSESCPPGDGGQKSSENNTESSSNDANVAESNDRSSISESNRKNKNAKIHVISTSDSETYEVEILDDSSGHLLLETDETQGTVYIKKIIKSPCTEQLRKVAKYGDILLAVNEHVVLHDEFTDIVSYLDTLRSCQYPRKLKFLNPSKCPLRTYIERSAISKNTNRLDMFGFNRNLDYLITERKHINSYGQWFSQRDLEWVEYLKAIGGPDNLKPAGVFKPSLILKLLVRRGIPVAFRPLIWQKISLCSMHRREFEDNYYNILLSRVEIELDNRVKEDIEKDVDRTFPEHEYFGGKGEENQGENSLRRVLRCFALHNRQIGYCQSLNFVAGMMLLFMNEEDAFWLLVTVVETLLPKDYYTKSMVGIYTDQCVLGRIIQLKLPRIHNLLESFQLQLPLITVQWFLCLFVNTLRTEITLRIWDMFLNEGSKVLFRIAVALFQIHEEQLLKTRDAGELFLKLRDLGKEVVDADVLIALAYESHNITVPLVSVVQNSSVPCITAPGVTGHSSQGFTQNTSTYARMSMQVPKTLIGIGLAHLGPINIFRKQLRVSDDLTGSDINPKASESTKSKGDDTSNNSNNDNDEPFMEKASNFLDSLIGSFKSGDDSQEAKDEQDDNISKSSPLYEPDYGYMLNEGYHSGNDDNDEVSDSDFDASFLVDSNISTEDIEPRRKQRSKPKDESISNDSPSPSPSSSESSSNKKGCDCVLELETLSMEAIGSAPTSEESPVEVLRVKNTVYLPQFNGDAPVATLISDFSKRGSLQVSEIMHVLFDPEIAKGTEGGRESTSSKKGGSSNSTNNSNNSNNRIKTFKRLDIQLWRNGYRPQLEERYTSMQAMRKKWKYEQEREKEKERLRVREEEDDDNDNNNNSDIEETSHETPDA